ncbi:MAG: hypothetical protein WCO04_13355 [Pseudomonadota bacterium]
MKDAERLDRLGKISALLREKKLRRLQDAAQSRQISLNRLAALDAPMPPADLTTIAAEEVALRYAVWVDQRRREINLTLARQTVEWLGALQEAAVAFGRDQVVQGLAEPPAGPIRRAARYR